MEQPLALFHQIDIATDADPTFIHSKSFILFNISQLIFVIAVTYMTYSAKKLRYLFNVDIVTKWYHEFSKLSGIARRQQNILGIQSQCIYNYLLIMCLSLDQFKNHYLEINYNKMSKDDVFDLWIGALIIENIGKKILKISIDSNIKLYVITFFSDKNDLLYFYLCISL